MKEIKNFNECMNSPINPFEGHSMEYTKGAIDYCGFMHEEMWNVYDEVTSVALKKAFRGTNIMPSKRMEIIEIVQDLIRLTGYYYEDYVLDNGNAHMNKILDDMEQSGVPDQSRKTPCDYPDNYGHYSCPFDAQGGDDCRNYCGLGVDE